MRAAASRKPQAASGGGTEELIMTLIEAWLLVAGRERGGVPLTAGTVRDFLRLSDLTESPSVAVERSLG